MKRIAVLVGAPCRKQNMSREEQIFVSSVQRDIHNIQHFLRSPMGGAWDIQQEVIVLQDPTVQQYQNLLYSSRACDYRLFYFAGHGDAAHIQINSQDKVPIADIQVSPYQKQLRIFDSCRVDVKQRTGLANDVMIEKLADYRYRQDELQAARWLFNNVLQDMLQGTTTLYACQKRRLASGNNEGGYFTSSLIRTALDMTEEQHQIITTDAIFRRVQQSIIQQTNNEQVPEMENSLRTPFALSNVAVQQLARQIVQSQNNTEQGIPTWGKVLLGIGGVAVLAWLINQFDED